MKSHYLWNIFIAVVTTVLIVQYDFPFWIWIITALISVFEFEIKDEKQ